MLRLALVAVCALTLAACGSDDDDAGGGSPPAATQLTVTVWPEGRDGQKRVRKVECPGDDACRGLSMRRLAPVPPETPCTAIYGGPDEARVTGTIDGKRVDVTFSREDGCQISRWERNIPLLGPPSNKPG